MDKEQRYQKLREALTFIFGRFVGEGETFEDVVINSDFRSPRRPTVGEIYGMQLALKDAGINWFPFARKLQERVAKNARGLQLAMWNSDTGFLLVTVQDVLGLAADEIPD